MNMHLQISEWNTGKENEKKSLGKFCGNNRPTFIASSTDLIQVHFVSDISLARNGFRLEWIVNGKPNTL